MIENAGGDVEKAAEAERRIIEELRQMGNEVLHGWARRQQQKKEGWAVCLAVAGQIPWQTA